MLPPVLEKLPQLDVVRCYFEPDGSFPNHEPNPLLPENREFIVRKVTEEGADIGVAYDGDADRCFFVDDTGQFVPGDFATALMAEAMLAKAPGEKVIYDVRASWAVPETIERAGGTPLVNRVGHAFIKQRMRAEDALFGGEVSAHYYFREFSQADTGVVPFLVMLELVSRSGTKLSDLLRPYRERFFLTGEINTPVADVALKLQELKERYSTRGWARLAPRRHLDRVRRLALQCPPVEHRAAAATQSRGPLREPHGREARRGARAHPLVTSRARARSRHRPAAAVQVLGARPRVVLGHRRAGCRLLRALPPVLRPRTHRVPPAPGSIRDAGPRVRHARVERRVPRAGAVRRPHRGVRAREPDRPHERDVRVRRVPAARRHAHGHGAPDARPHRPRRAPTGRRSRRS